MTYVDKHGRCVSYATAAQEVFDVSGAGDTVVAVVAAFLAAGYKAETAIEAANYAAAISVSKLGTYTVDIDEIFGLWGNSAVNFDRKIVDRRELGRIIADWKRDNKKIVFTNGCFDILHTGHITYLKKAKQLGDKLIIGLNTDRSVKALKGDLRPVNPQEDRALLLAALAFVDLIVLFDEDTPYELIKAVRPYVLVKGGDYKPEKVVGREFAGEVVIIPFVDGYSTTNVLRKLDSIEIA
jgi:D-beta-D-heptose 7-phosphate kinase/D-beta-D-heptose 1-phosphate adenosyltransferase